MSRAADLAAVGAGVASSANATAISISATEVVTLLTSAVATSEGGAVTTNIAQGLAKGWSRLDDNSSLEDSFNISGVTDHSTGIYTLTHANNMGSVNYAISGLANYGAGTNDANNQGIASTADDLLAASFKGYHNVAVNDATTFALQDAHELFTIFHGDLA